MNFHEQLFKNKGWKPGQGSTKISVISVMRSDMVQHEKYCRGFYQDLTFTLNRLNLKRSNGSCDIDETGCAILQSRPENELSTKVNELIISGTRPIIFYGEDSPISQKVIKDFAEFISLKHGIGEYALALINKGTKDVTFTLQCKGKKDAHFKLHNLTSKLEEV